MKKVFQRIWLYAAALPGFMPTSAYAAPAKVHIDCALRYTTQVDCETFKTSFFTTYDKLSDRHANPESADLLLSLVDEPWVNNQVRYSFQWTSNLSQTRGSSTTIPLIAQNSLDSLALLNALTLNAAKGFALYLKIESQTIDDNGALIVVYGRADDGTVLPEDPNFWEKLEKSPFYAEINGNGNSSKSGSGSNGSNQSNYSANVNLSYLKDRYKIELNGSMSLSSQSYPNGSGGKVTGSAKEHHHSAIVVYSLSEKWSVAVINNTTVAPANNIEHYNNTQAGVEWSLVPFRTTENKELAFRLGSDFTTMALGAPNDLDHLREKYIGAFAQIYFYWMLKKNKVTLQSNATLFENLKYQDRYRINLSGSIHYQVTRAVSMNASASYQYKPFSMTYPKAPDFSNSIQTMFLGGQAGSSMFYSVGVQLRIGNSLKKIRDRRWIQ